MRFKIGMVIGAGIGYLVGSGKGRELVDRARVSLARARSAQEYVVPGRPTGSAAGGAEPLLGEPLGNAPVGAGIV